MQVRIGWGAAPREISVPDGSVVLEPPGGLEARSWPDVLAQALATPVGAPLLEARLAAVRSVCVLVPDHTRKDVAEALLPLVLPLLAGRRISVGVATGKHPPGAPPVGAWVHDARSDALIPVGQTPAGTTVAYPKAVLEADLRLLLGEIRPHYFAGYAGGAKLLFPGVAGEAGIWQNHRLKATPGARLGVVDGNPCRQDMEDAAALAGPSYLINVVRGASGQPVFAVAGDPVAAHRAGVAHARAVFEVQIPPGPRFDTVLVSDTHPVSASLYQACKLLAPAGALLADGGTVILAVACTEGLGPVEVINEAIYRLGLVHSLPARHRVVLVSERSRSSVAETFATYAPDVETALAMAGPGRLAVLPQAGDLVPRI